MSDVFVVMQAVSGKGFDKQGNNIQWFEYRPSFFGPIVRVEWDHDTLQVVLSDETVANYLMKHNYARPMTEQEVAEYHAQLAREEAEYHADNQLGETKTETKGAKS